MLLRVQIKVSQHLCSLTWLAGWSFWWWVAVVLEWEVWQADMILSDGLRLSVCDVKINSDRCCSVGAHGGALTLWVLAQHEGWSQLRTEAVISELCIFMLHYEWMPVSSGCNEKHCRGPGRDILRFTLRPGLALIDRSHWARWLPLSQLTSAPLSLFIIWMRFFSHAYWLVKSSLIFSQLMKTCSSMAELP